MRNACFIALCGAALLAATVHAQPAVFTWNGSQSSSWKNKYNWNRPQGVERWPGENTQITDDEVIIAYININTPMPQLDNGGNIKIGKLEIQYDTQPATLTLVDPGDPLYNALTVTKRDALTVQANCQLILGQDCFLLLDGGGDIALDGVVRFDGPNAKFELLGAGYDYTYVTTGSGSFRGTGAGVMTGEAILVLGVNNAIEGNMDVSLPLVNNGLVTTDIPGVDNFADTIHLWCEPMIGAGDWEATGGGSGDGQRNWLVVDTLIAGSGDLVVGEYGGVQVHRHLTLSGTLTVERRARIEVDKEVMFDVDRFVPENCPD